MTKDEFDERQAKLRFEYSCRKTAIEEEYAHKFESKLKSFESCPSKVKPPPEV